MQLFSKLFGPFLQWFFLVLQEGRDSLWSSAILAASLRDLPAQWEEVFEYRPLLAETFTDPETHEGTCYKASGWEPVGMSRADGKHYADLYPGAARPKKLWLKPLEPKAREKLCAEDLAQAQQAGVAAHAGARCALKTSQRYLKFCGCRLVRCRDLGRFSCPPASAKFQLFLWIPSAELHRACST